MWKWGISNRKMPFSQRGISISYLVINAILISKCLSKRPAFHIHSAITCNVLQFSFAGEAGINQERVCTGFHVCRESMSEIRSEVAQVSRLPIADSRQKKAPQKRAFHNIRVKKIISGGRNQYILEFLYIRFVLLRMHMR